MFSNICFVVQMLGSCPVFKAQGSGCTDEAVQQIVANTKKVCVGDKRSFAPRRGGLLLSGGASPYRPL